MESSQAGQRQFLTTRRSVVLAAGREGGTREAREALEKLAQSYWYPLYAFLRRRGTDSEEARDLVQGLFVLLLERQDLAAVAPEKGRFRAFLLASLKHHLFNERARQMALKRGGGRVLLQIDAAAADSRYACEPAHAETPEKLYDQSWASSVLERALGRVAEAYRQRGQAELFGRLQPLLARGAEAPPREELAAELGLSEGALKVAVHRLRRRFRAELRSEIAETVAEPGQVEDEIRHLFDALGG